MSDESPDFSGPPPGRPPSNSPFPTGFRPGPPSGDEEDEPMVVGNELPLGDDAPQQFLDALPTAFSLMFRAWLPLLITGLIWLVCAVILIAIPIVIFFEISVDLENSLTDSPIVETWIPLILGGIWSVVMSTVVWTYMIKRLDGYRTGEKKVDLGFVIDRSIPVFLYGAIVTVVFCITYFLALQLTQVFAPAKMPAGRVLFMVAMYQMLRPYILAYLIALFVAIFLSFGDTALILEEESFVGAFKRSVQLTAGFGHWLHVLLTFLVAQFLFMGGYFGISFAITKLIDPMSRRFEIIMFIYPFASMIVAFAMAAAIKYILFRSLIARNLHMGNFQELMVDD